MRFVDEQDDRLRAFLDLVDDVLQAILEFTLDAGPGLQQAHVEGVQFDTEQGAVRSSCAMRRAKPSTTAVLPTPASPVRIGLFCRRAHQDVDHLANLAIAPDDRVDLAVPRPLRQVGCELVESRCLAALRTHRQQWLVALPAFLRTPQAANFGSFG